MHTPLRQLLARTHRRTVTATTENALAVSSYLEPFWGAMVIRIAAAADRRSLERLTELDSTEAPTGATLIGELRERPVAALSLSDGKIIADPFVATSDIVALLRLRAGQLNPRSRARAPERLGRPEHAHRGELRVVPPV